MCSFVQLTKVSIGSNLSDDSQLELLPFEEDEINIYYHSFNLIYFENCFQFLVNETNKTEKKKYWIN